MVIETHFFGVVPPIGYTLENLFFTAPTKEVYRDVQSVRNSDGVGQARDSFSPLIPGYCVFTQSAQLGQHSAAYVSALP